VWKTTSAGASWDPIFDDQETSSIGDVTLAPSNPNVVWVGTGEPQNRQSSPWGNGVYRSLDAGRNWVHLGLEETHHIARIVVHPTDPNTAYVAAVGHLWGSNPERGVYKTNDGGETWEKILFIDDDTGAIDLIMDPADPNTLLAAMYQRRRTGFGFNGGGPGSGIYRTYDAGRTWTELTTGLPNGIKGRIGLDVYRNDGNLVYAVVQADEDGGVYRSADRGDTWEKMSGTNPRPMYYSQIRIDPNNPDRIYLGGTQLMVSDDAGKTFRDDGAPGVHVDHHALWINPNDSDHLLLGSDGGISTSYDGGMTWRMFDNLPIGQFYQIGADMRDPYYVCGGMQDNSSWCAPNRNFTMYGIRNGDWYDVWGGDGFFNVPDPSDHNIVWSESQGGNLGRYNVATGERAQLQPAARPGEDGEERALRWNWNAPIVISSHDPETVYVGSNILFKTEDRGHSWTEASEDLTKAIDRSELTIMGATEDEMLSRHDGIGSYGNITAIAESPINEAVLYVGTDDGNLQVTTDGGATWSNVVGAIRNLPERTYVSRIVASRFAEGRVYATFDGHRNDDFQAHVFVSEDFGRRWRSIAEGLPETSVNAIAEHHRSENLLFLGNEVGVYVSVNRGSSWVRMKSNLPTVPVDDIVIHPRDNDLILGTHGRSIWVLHDLNPLEQVAAEQLTNSAHLFPIGPAVSYNVSGGWPFSTATFAAANPPVGARLRYYLTDSTETSLTVLDAAGDTIRKLDTEMSQGFHETWWDLRIEPRESEGGSSGFFGPPQPPSVLPGTYTAVLTTGSHSVSESFEVLADPRTAATMATRNDRQRLLMEIYELSGSISEAQDASRRVLGQLRELRTLAGTHDGVSDSLVTALDEIVSRVETLDEKIRGLNRGLRVGRAIEGTSAAPTEDQRWRIEELWKESEEIISDLNVVITQEIPSIHDEFNQIGVRPDPGKAITLPTRP
ncbi:MAG: hypothetical protein OEZ54_09300, partial [Gemmatimonadota bacterium]|nr:hypothetical protein [Gemmatimonadota bacterium]